MTDVVFVVMGCLFTQVCFELNLECMAAALCYIVYFPANIESNNLMSTRITVDIFTVNKIKQKQVWKCV